MDTSDAQRMKPEEFLKREQFEALSEEDKDAYVSRFLESERPGAADTDWLTWNEHFLDLGEWWLTADEYDRLVRTPLWNLMWRDAETMLAAVVELLDAPDLSSQDRAFLHDRLKTWAALIKHKRDLDELPE